MWHRILGVHGAANGTVYSLLNLFDTDLLQILLSFIVYLAHALAIGMVPGSCGDPGTPDMGTRNLTSTTIGSIVEYSCNTRYKLNGMATRLCQDNQEWSGELPTCVSK